MTLALYRKWRPQTWDQVVGQDHVVTTLRNAVHSNHVVHAYLFAGPRGTGKTTTARLLAKAVNCLAESLDQRPCNQCHHCLAVNEGRFLDLVEIDAASNTSVEDVRDLRDRINFSPNEGRFKVYIIDEVHMLSTAAFNALLKTLEEPPSHAIFVLATTEVHKVLPTVLSRCQRHEFRRIPLTVIVEYLRQQSTRESLEVEPEAIELIARQATGSLRDAVSLLDQLASTGQAVRLELAREVLGTATAEAVRAIVKAWAGQQQAEGLTLINQALDGGTDPRQLARQVVDYLRKLLLVRMGATQPTDILADERQELGDMAREVSLPRLLAAIRGFSTAGTERWSSGPPSLPLEMAFLEATVLGDEGKGEQPDRGGGAGGSRPDEPARKNAPQAKGASPAPQEGGGKAATASQPVPPLAKPAGEKPRDANVPTSTPPTSVLSQAAPAQGSVSFQSVADHWKEVLATTFRHNPRAQALLNSCRPLGLEDKALVLSFHSDLLVEKMEKEHNLAAVRQALQEVLGVSLEVRCVSRGKDATTKAPQPAAPVEDGGIVATALRDLGAQVVEVKRPDEEVRGVQGS